MEDKCCVLYVRQIGLDRWILSQNYGLRGIFQGIYPGEVAGHALLLYTVAFTKMELIHKSIVTHSKKKSFGHNFE